MTILRQKLGLSPIALVTGCSSGIGLCVAKGLRESGWRVFATARSVASVSELVEQGFEALQLDVADSDSIRRCVAEILLLTGGRLDALFNNAGFGVPGAVEDLTREAMRYQFETNVFGAIELTNAVLPVMRQQGYGTILFNSSVLGFAAMPYRGAYNASKFALEGFVDTLRQELYGTKIDVCLIEPGPIVSEFRANAAKQFSQWVDPSRSFHAKSYYQMSLRLEKQGSVAPFTLPAEAVFKVVGRALAAKKPKVRYRVTIPTQVFWYLKRLLPSKCLDRVLLLASGDEPGVSYGRNPARRS
ncbi:MULTISPECIES: SDR family NAD(P)-dependent oxidoreductase [Deefgea]|uniref:SDR family NAD(P)-dependent oxidoreductase n=1 Tax=Deefgea chitinilytica TaxID=570276 RepID=A0ABS2C9G9_9NEIS|nr:MULTISPECIES: SDR family NAD(P)-dependent oxidoreductase [Deefgea]MBM5570793.1 SDR family NAD(P)-dependent oxidoreductase [Deefgea chitinilytica]MBM9888022.1 SDR family NAD(P)-dependent oxidoreductase [Deefgea sp. CFH1-16]